MLCDSHHNTLYGLEEEEDTMSIRPKLWFATLAITGIISSNIVAGILYSLPLIGAGCINLAAAAVMGAPFVATVIIMRRKGMLRWWHVALVVAVGAALFPSQTPTIGHLCISGPYAPPPGFLLD